MTSFIEKFFGLEFQALGARLANILLWLLIVIVSFKIIGKLCEITVKFLKKSKVELSVVTFLNSVLKFSLRIFVLVTAISSLGFNMTAVMAALGASLVTIGLALKDNVANLISGILIIIYKPFKVGDYIEIESFKGVVAKLEMMFTTVDAEEDKIIIIPNIKLAMNSIVKKKN